MEEITKGRFLHCGMGDDVSNEVLSIYGLTINYGKNFGA